MNKDENKQIRDLPLYCCIDVESNTLNVTRADQRLCGKILSISVSNEKGCDLSRKTRLVLAKRPETRLEWKQKQANKNGQHYITDIIVLRRKI